MESEEVPESANPRLEEAADPDELAKEDDDDDDDSPQRGNLVIDVQDPEPEPDPETNPDLYVEAERDAPVGQVEDEARENLVIEDNDAAEEENATENADDLNAVVDTPPVELSQLDETCQTSIRDVQTQENTPEADASYAAMEVDIVPRESIESLKLEIQDLKTKLRTFEEEHLKEKESYESFHKQRDDAINERNMLMNMITRLNSEINYMKELHLKTSQQLKNTIDSNCEIMSKNEQLKIKEISLQYREELMAQEKTILDDKIQNFIEELSSKNQELEAMRIEHFTKISSLEIQLASKSEELKIADNDVTHLREHRLKLISEIENLNRKLDEQREVESKICDDLRKKLTAKTKIADLYKSMREDSDAKCEELMNGVNELRKLLNEAVEKYGDLESKNLKLEMDHDAIIKQKNNLINSLQEDLENTKKDLEMKKSERFISTLKKLSPTASIMRDFLKSGMSFVEIYNQLVCVTEELEKRTSENTQLNEALSTIIKDIEENAPFIKEQMAQNEENCDKNIEIAQQLESMELEYNRLREDYAESSKVNIHFEKENKKLKQELNDLGQQVCFLLKEIELNRGGNLFAEKDVSISTTSSEHSSFQIISKNLVTFSDIQELQMNNQKLLKLVREVCDKQEELDEVREQIDSGEYQEKLDTLNEKINDLSSTNERQAKTINNLIQQRNMYKKLYHSKKGGTHNSEFMDEDDDEADVNNMNESVASKNSTLRKKSFSHVDEIKILKGQLEETQKQLEQQKIDRKVCENLSDSKEKLLLSKTDKLEKEISDLNEKYRKYHCTAEASNEKNKLLLGNLTACKKTISTLENSIEKYNIKIAEYESTAKYLNDKLRNYEKKLEQNDTTIANLQKECKLMRDLKNNLLKEKEKLAEELHNQSALIVNFEVIKNMIEKKQISEKSTLENKMEEFTRECSLLRRKLQDKEVGFSETAAICGSSDFEKVKLEVLILREEVDVKSKTIEELKEMLCSGEYSQLKEEIKTLKTELDEKKTEIISLSERSTNNKEHLKQFSDISKHAEVELKSLNDQFTEYRSETETKLAQYKSTIENLNEKCSELEAELSLQNTNHGELNNEISNAEEIIKTLTQQVFDKSESLDKMQIEHNKLIDETKSLENQISYFVSTNAEINQQKSSLENKIIELNQKITSLSCEQVECQEQLSKCKLSCDENIESILAEKNQLESQISDLKNHNTILHNQLETFNTQIILNQSSNQPRNLNDSFSSDLDGSTLETETKAHLLQIIKYLRNDRDLHGRKFDSMREENLRIKSELDTAQISLNELQKSQVKSSDDFQNSSNASLHFEMVNQLETLNTLSASNTLLRDERSKNLNTIKTLSEKLKELEEKTETAQKHNEELSKRINSVLSEKSCIQAECTRWKTRVSSLLEKTNKTNPEDWKRLQNERETLAKMLSSEKENTKKVREEATLFKLEKNKLEEQITALNVQLGNIAEENKKQCADLRNDITQLSTDLNEARSTIKEKMEENQQLNENLAASNSVITEARNKEIQLRKIAKLYKTQYEALTKSVDEDKKKTESSSTEVVSVSHLPTDAQKEFEQRVIELEKSNSAKTAELEAQVSSSLEENSTLHKEIQSLKSKNENTEERAKIAMKQAQNKITQLSELKENLTKELNDVKAKLDNLEQNKDEHDVRLTALKSQYEGRLLKLEKEKNQLQITQQNEVSQLNKQIEALTQKITQMQRQIDTQAVKPTTSSSQVEKSGTEPPTANIKPMAGSQTTVGGRRLGSETPLASIKPMTSVPAVRTAAVLPTTVSPHQSSHTSGTTIGDTMSSSPSSSHATEYLPASSSTTNRVHPQSNQQTHASPPESTQDSEMDNLKSEAVVHANMSATSLGNMPGNQQVVALVSPRMETSNDESAQLTSSNNGSSSTVTTSYLNPVEQSNDNRDNTTQKRSRTEFTEEKPNPKRAKVQEPSECEAEYQVPTSSQKDQEDDSVIVVDSDDEENDYEGSNLYMDDDDDDDDDDDEDDDDIEDEEEEEEDEDDEDNDNEDRNNEEDNDDGDVGEMGNEANEKCMEEEDDDNDVRDIDEDIVEEVVDEGEEDENYEEEEEESPIQSDEEIENETEAAADSISKKAGANTSVEYIDDASENSDEEKETPPNESSTMLHSSDEHMRMLSSNSENMPRTSFLTLRPPGSGLNQNAPSGTYEEGDDSIVPSTPTLYVPNRNDGFGEAVRSPLIENPSAERFSFNPNNSQGVMENTHADLTPQLSSRQSEMTSNRAGNNAEGFDNAEANEAVRNLEASFS